jgi:hypothetical protein
MRTLAWLITLALFAGPAAAAAQVGGGIDIAGLVIDEESGEPLSAVVVRVAGSELGTLTDDEGRYRLRDVPNVNSLLLAERLGYIPEARALWVCNPTVHPPESCTASFPRDQVMRFYMRPTPDRQRR